MGNNKRLRTFDACQVGHGTHALHAKCWANNRSRVYKVHRLQVTEYYLNIDAVPIRNSQTCWGRSQIIQKSIVAVMRWQHGMQVRGSIPLYWNQEGVTHLKPDITLQHYDPLYTATRLHFEVPQSTCYDKLLQLLPEECLLVSIVSVV